MSFNDWRSIHVVGSWKHGRDSLVGEERKRVGSNLNEEQHVTIEIPRYGTHVVSVEKGGSKRRETAS